VLVPGAVICLTAGAVYWATQGIRDRAVEWTIVGGLFTGAAVLVAVLALPFAIWQLWIVQQEQERIVEQLGKAPEIELGLLPDWSQTFVDSIDGERPTSANQVGQVPVRVRATNHGGRSAHNPRLQVAVPLGNEILNLVGDLDVKVHDGAKWVTLSERVLNPEESVDLIFGIQLTHTSPDEIPVVCSFSSEDAFPLQRICRIRVPQLANNGQQEAESPLWPPAPAPPDRKEPLV